MTRIGIGYDVHRFGESRPLVLGGVEFPGESGLAGHSDADVLLHALIDALLGAAGMGDIGTHFPPDDERWAGANSSGMLRQVIDKLSARSFRVGNVDVTVIAERPRLGLRIAEIRAALADIISVDVDRVNVKATTNEGLGAIGQGEGIAAIAVALIEEGR